MNRSRLRRIGALLVVLYVLPAGLDLASASLGAKATGTQNISVGNFRTEVTATVGTQNLTTLSLTTGNTVATRFANFFVQNFGTTGIASFTLGLSTVTGFTNVYYCTGTTGAFSAKATCGTGTRTSAALSTSQSLTVAIPAGTRIAFQVVSSGNTATTVASVTVAKTNLNASVPVNS
ncbi:MAG: hypothetical protein WCO08_06040 [Actinomycetes bacterium]